MEKFSLADPDFKLTGLEGGDLSRQGSATNDKDKGQGVPSSKEPSNSGDSEAQRGLMSLNEQIAQLNAQHAKKFNLNKAPSQEKDTDSSVGGDPFAPDSEARSQIGSEVGSDVTGLYGNSMGLGISGPAVRPTLDSIME